MLDVDWERFSPHFFRATDMVVKSLPVLHDQGIVQVRPMMYSLHLEKEHLEGGRPLGKHINETSQQRVSPVPSRVAAFETS